MLMELDTESCSSRASEFSPAVSRKRSQKVEVFHEVLRRLRRSESDVACQPGFEDELWAHFNRLPLRYAREVNVERAQEVLMHKRLLHMAYDPNTRPAFEVRCVQVHPPFNGDGDDGTHWNYMRKDARSSDYPGRQSIHPPPAFGSSTNLQLLLEANKSSARLGSSSMSADQHLYRPLHEITISTYDKPKLLAKLTALISDIGLNIQEAHAFSTIDGYSLDVFLVEGWAYEETEKLKEQLAKEIPTIEQILPWSNDSLPSPSAEVREMEIQHILRNVELPMDRGDQWEIDPQLLKFEHKIAAGAYGDLYKGTFCSQDVAIKSFRNEYLNENLKKEFAQEVYILRKVRHQNVVQFIGACTRRPNICIVTEYMAGGSLYDFLHKQNGRFSLPVILKVAIDVSQGMNYLHENSIIHRDLKTANLLMDGNEMVKVADFGVARVQNQSGVMTAETGTYRWMAPEVIEHRPYSHKADIFSFGVVLWELLTGKVPYAHLSPLQAAIGVVQKGIRPTIPKHTHPEIVALLERCWQQDPSMRPDFSEIIEMLHHIYNLVVIDGKRSNKRRNRVSGLKVCDA